MTRARCECCRTLLITASGRLLCPNPTCPRPAEQMTLEQKTAA